MSAFRNSANALKAFETVRGRDTTGTLRTFNTIRMRDASNTLRTVFTSLNAFASPPSVSGTQGSFGPGSLTITSNAVTAAPVGGVAPYAYSWAYSSGDTGITITSASSASTAFSKSLALGIEVAADFTCVVTDVNGATAIASVSVSLNHVNLN